MPRCQGAWLSPGSMLLARSPSTLNTHTHFVCVCVCVLDGRGQEAVVLEY